MLSLGDFIRNRNNKGEKWPTKELIYQWKFWNYLQFADECIRMLGTKILIDEDAFELWLRKNAHKTQGTKILSNREPKEDVASEISLSSQKTKRC